MNENFECIRAINKLKLYKPDMTYEEFTDSISAFQSFYNWDEKKKGKDEEYTHLQCDFSFVGKYKNYTPKQLKEVLDYNYIFSKIQRPHPKCIIEFIEKGGYKKGYTYNDLMNHKIDAKLCNNYNFKNLKYLL